MDLDNISEGETPPSSPSRHAPVLSDSDNMLSIPSVTVATNNQKFTSEKFNRLEGDLIEFIVVKNVLHLLDLIFVNYYFLISKLL